LSCCGSTATYRDILAVAEVILGSSSSNNLFSAHVRSVRGRIVAKRQLAKNI
jgi:hypothetical protein